MLNGPSARFPSEARSPTRSTCVDEMSPYTSNERTVAGGSVAAETDETPYAAVSMLVAQPRTSTGKVTTKTPVLSLETVTPLPVIGGGT